MSELLIVKHLVGSWNIINITIIAVSIICQARLCDVYFKEEERATWLCADF